jgi:hypothetical protein
MLCTLNEGNPFFIEEILKWLSAATAASEQRRLRGAIILCVTVPAARHAGRSHRAAHAQEGGMAHKLFSLHDLVALITGRNGGLGRAIELKLQNEAPGCNR